MPDTCIADCSPPPSPPHPPPPTGGGEGQPSKHTTYIQRCTTLYEGYFHNVVKKTYQQRCYNVEGQRCSATWPQHCRTTLYLCCILHVSFTTLQQRCKTYLNTTSRGLQCLKRKTFFILKHSGIYFNNSTCFKVINNMP